MVVMASSSAESSGIFIFISSLYKPTQKTIFMFGVTISTVFIKLRKKRAPKVSILGQEVKKKTQQKAVLRPVKVWVYLIPYVFDQTQKGKMFIIMTRDFSDLSNFTLIDIALSPGCSQIRWKIFKLGLSLIILPNQANNHT